MSSKSATNGQAPTPAAKPKPPGVAARVAKLEAQVAELIAQNDRITRLLVGQLENQAVARMLPAAEQQLRAGIQQRFAQGGLAALLGEDATPQP